MSNRQIVESALRSIHVLGEGESANDEQAASALEALNDMLEAWAEDGVDLQHFRQTDIEADSPLPAWTLRGVKAALAVELSGEYGAPITASLANKAEAGYQTIARRMVSEQIRPADLSHLPRGYPGYYDIVKDA